MPPVCAIRTRSLLRVPLPTGGCGLRQEHAPGSNLGYRHAGPGNRDRGGAEGDRRGGHWTYISLLERGKQLLNLRDVYWFAHVVLDAKPSEILRRVELEIEQGE
jgi:hypothetical protein